MNPDFYLTLTFVITSIVLIVLLTSVFKFNTFFSLLLVSIFLAITCLPSENIVSTLVGGFGHTMEKIGLIIILGAAIGVVLDKTGATINMAKAILHLIGKKNTDKAIGVTGFITGMPIFCDSGFIVLSGLNKRLSRSSGKPVVLMASVLGISLYSVHCLIPPHPGAMFATIKTGANIGYVILLGVLLAIPGAVLSYLWICYQTRNEPKTVGTHDSLEPDDKSHLPNVALSFLPVILPLFLITFKSLITLFKTTEPSLVNAIADSKITQIMGDPVFALLAGLFAALLLALKSSEPIGKMLSVAVEKSGHILIIIAGGGTFGAVIKATNIGDQLGGLLAQTNLGVFIPFILASILKTAQGSSTVAVMTTASILSPMLASLGLDSPWGLVLATLSMGAGSMTVSHANDAYFWVITEFSGIQPNQTLKVYSTATVILGLTTIFCIYFASLALL